jgi:alkanesulfonate monooxygenase SsuD/methylene tetrahydromethanopterin reductase-like flavin-dependent oxidoreductase (luciferase family)
MSTVEIDRITLRLAASSADDGARLARRVADGLASWRPPPDLARAVDRLQVPVVRDAGESIDALGERIIAALIRELERTS